MKQRAKTPSPTTSNDSPTQPRPPAHSTSKPHSAHGETNERDATRQRKTQEESQHEDQYQSQERNRTDHRNTRSEGAEVPQEASPGSYVQGSDARPWPRRRRGMARGG